MRNAFGTDLNQAGLVDDMVGDAYDTVKRVADALAYVTHVSQNLETVFGVSQSLPVLEAFINDPSFLTFLTDNMDDLAALSAAYATLYHNTVKLNVATSQITGYVALGTGAPMIKQKVVTGTTPVPSAYALYNLGLGGDFTNNRILSFDVIVSMSDGTRRNIDASMGAWFSETQLRLFCHDDATIFGNRPFTCLITYTDEA
jgi:hypothetical protein